MGRVARYKKVKAFDKLGKSTSTHIGRGQDAEYIWGTDIGRKGKKRSVTATQLQQQKMKRTKPSSSGNELNNGYDLAPDHIKDDFDLNDIVGSVRREKKKSLEEDLKDVSTITSNTQLKTITAPPSHTKPAAVIVNETVQVGNRTIHCHIPRNEEEEKNLMKRLNIHNNKSGTALSQQVKAERSIEGRKEGESMRAFEKRLKQETRSILLNSTTKLLSNEDKRKRKKEFLNKKKLKNNSGSGNGNLDPFPSNRSTQEKVYSNKGMTAKTSGQEISPVTFLNQVERPPTFHMLPRGAEDKHGARLQQTATVSQSQGSKKRKKEEDPEIVKLREKMRIQYRAMKQKRREEEE